MPLPENHEEMLAGLDALINERTRLVCISHVDDRHRNAAARQGDMRPRPREGRACRDGTRRSRQGSSRSTCATWMSTSTQAQATSGCSAVGARATST